MSRLASHVVGEVPGGIKILARRAGSGHVQTHDFRQTVETTLLRTHDAAIVAKLLGHSSLAATLIYDHSGQDEQRSAIGTLPLPECAVAPELKVRGEVPRKRAKPLESFRGAYLKVRGRTFRK